MLSSWLWFLLELLLNFSEMMNHIVSYLLAVKPVFVEQVVKRAYQGIISMTYSNHEFFWTDGEVTWREEYDEGFSQYRHNQLLLFDPPYSGFQLYHPKAQPTPGEAPPTVEQKEIRIERHVYTQTYGDEIRRDGKWICVKGWEVNVCIYIYMHIRAYTPNNVKRVLWQQS